MISVAPCRTWYRTQAMTSGTPLAIPSATDIAFCLERIVQTIRSFLAPTPPRVLVVVPPPILETGCLAEMFAGGAAKSLALGPAIAAMCDRIGADCFDAGRHIAVSPVDGIHYEAEDQIALGLALAERVRKILA